jgi:NAD-dependent deacetylase
MIDQDQQRGIARIAAMIAKARRVVVFTGAGVSTESGIPDFRSPGGIWTKFDPEDFTIDRFWTSPETRRKQWRFLVNGELFKDARPNAAHEAIAELERLGRLDCVITQNIDNLHQRAGNDPARVFELHGNMKWIRCLECGRRYPLEEIVRGNEGLPDPPVCGHCSGILKPDVIFFGEALPEDALREATRHANHCDLLLAVGSSLVVYPAAYMPFYAKQAGAGLAIVNLSPTPADRMADVIVRASAGETMRRIVAEVGRRLAGSCA